jgi:hypothetical protein
MPGSDSTRILSGKGDVKRGGAFWFVTHGASSLFLFDDVVRAGEHRRRHVEAERLGGLKQETVQASPVPSRVSKPNRARDRKCVPGTDQVLKKYWSRRDHSSRRSKSLASSRLARAMTRYSICERWAPT